MPTAWARRTTALSENQNGSRSTKSYRTIEDIPARKLLFDPRVNRDLIPARVKHFKENMDLDAIGVATVSRRAGNKNIVIDAQHRVRALIDLDMGDWEVRCDVYHGLKLAEEAELFRRLNDARRPTAMDDFLKGITAGDAECLAIQDLAAEAGLTVRKEYGDGNVGCVDKLRKLYRGKDGEVILPTVFQTATAAWGTTAEAVEGHIIAGLGEFFRHFDLANIDRDRLVKKLAKYPGGPGRLIGSARNLRDSRPGPVSHCVAITVTDLYNKGHRAANQLPAL